MLDNLRDFGRSWVAKIFLGVLILAVAGFGIPSVFLDLNANTVARVGDQNVTAREFDRLYRAQLNQFAARTGMAPTGQQALNFGLPNATLSQLANDASLEMLAQRLDLGASQDKLAELVRRDPSFAGALGTFDRSEFVAVLRQVGYTESEYLNLQRRVAKREQIGMIFDGISLPQVAADIANAYDNDRRTIEYVELNPIFFSVFEEPSEDELAQFFTENQNRFRTVETRRVHLLPLTAEAVAEGIEVSEAQVVAEYERTAAQYTTIEQRTVHQLLLENGETARLFELGLNSGRSFEDLVAEAGLQARVSRLGTFAQAQMTDPALAAAAFSLSEGAYSIIDGALGQRAVWVSEVIPGGVQPLEAVRGTIEASLKLAAARDELLSIYDEIEEARAAFLPIDDVAERHGMRIYELDLTRDGAALAGVTVLPQSTHATIVNQVFSASETASVTPAINLGSNRTVFFALEEVLPVRDQTLDEVRSEAIAAWQELQADLAITTAAQDMVSALDGGADMFMVAAEAGQIPQASQPFTRVGSEDGTVGGDVARSAFMGGEGHAGYARTQEGDVIVFQVTEVIPAAGDAKSVVVDNISSTFADLLYASFVEGLRQDTSIRINTETLNRLIGLE